MQTNMLQLLFIRLFENHMQLCNIFLNCIYLILVSFLSCLFQIIENFISCFFQNPLSNKKTTSNQNPQSDGSKSQGKPTSSPGTASANPNQSQTRSFHTLLYDSFFSDTSSYTNPILNYLKFLIMIFQENPNLSFFSEIIHLA